MDNVSHSLAGWALARAAGTRPPPGTTLALILASNLPDIDIVLEARSDVTYLLYHRGLTHSLVGLVILPLVLAAGLWWGYGRRTRFGWFALLSACGVGLHLVYDVVTPWGTMLLYPFSTRRYALDWLFIVDFVTWSLPVLVLILARWRPSRARVAVVAWLVALVVYGSGAALVHRSATTGISAAERSEGRAVAEAYAFPRLGAPWNWNGVAVAPPGAPEPRLSLHHVAGIPPQSESTGRVARGFDDPWVATALATRPGQAYLWWARVPAARVTRRGTSVTVTLHDLRYSRTLLPTAETWTPFAIQFRYDAASGQLLDVEW